MISGKTAAKRARARRKARAKEIAKAESLGEFVGKVGERINLIVTVESVKPYRHEHGITIYYVMSDSEGRVIVWKSSREVEQLNAGLKSSVLIKINGKVIKKTKYKGVNRTYVNRCKVLEYDCAPQD